MSILARLLGQCGKVRFKGEVDGKKIEGKVKVETFNISNEELAERLQEAFFVEYGKRIKNFEIVGFYQTN